MMTIDDIKVGMKVKVVNDEWSKTSRSLASHHLGVIGVVTEISLDEACNGWDAITIRMDHDGLMKTGFRFNWYLPGNLAAVSD